MESYLLPTFTVHYNSTCGGRRTCYHAAIRLMSEHKLENRELIWGSDTCFGRHRFQAQEAAAKELDLVKSRRCWPIHWKRPPGGDSSILQNKVPQKRNVYPHQARRLSKDQIQEALIKSGAVPEDLAAKTRDAIEKLDAKRMSEGVANALARKFEKTAPEPIKEPPKEEFLKSLFGSDPEEDDS